MCDYSLESQVSRAAQVGDKLVTAGFPKSSTHGFCASGAPEVAVCLMPGTELAFDLPVSYRGMWGLLLQAFQYESRMARFRKVDVDIVGTHHDALELDSGRIVLLTQLREGQRATVLQLPANPAHGELATDKETLTLVPAE